MKSTLKLIAVSFFLLIGAIAAMSSAVQPSFSPAENGMTEFSPRSLYVQNCARCHGSDGKSQTALGKKLEADDISGGGVSTAKAVRLITNGRGKMPSFKKKLTAAQISSIAGYIHSL